MRRGRQSVRRPVQRLLEGHDRILLLEPLPYDQFVWLLSKCRLILTDSGGVQEEAPTFGKPVLVMRDSTERPEAVESGVAKLVATDEERIFSETRILLENTGAYDRMSSAQNPYGDGTAARRIVDVFAERSGIDN